MFGKVKRPDELSPAERSLAQVNVEHRQAIEALIAATPGSVGALSVAGESHEDQLVMALGLADAVLAKAMERFGVGIVVQPKARDEYREAISMAIKQRKMRAVALRNHWLADAVPVADIDETLLRLHLAMQDRGYKHLPTSELGSANPQSLWAQLSESKWNELCAEYDRDHPEQRLGR